MQLVEGGERRMENHGISAHSSTHSDGRGSTNRNGEPVPILNDSYWIGRLFSRAQTRTLQNYKWLTSQVWPHWRNKKRQGSRSNPCIVWGYAVSTKATPVKECRPSRRNRSSYGSRRDPFTSIVALIGLIDRFLSNLSDLGHVRFDQSTAGALKPPRHSLWGVAARRIAWVTRKSSVIVELGILYRTCRYWSCRK